MEPNEGAPQGQSVYKIGDFSKSPKRLLTLSNSIDNQRLSLVADGSSSLSFQSFKVNDYSTPTRQLAFPMNESWVAYDNDRIIGGIDDTRGVSFRNLSGQLLLHHEYNSPDGVNIIPLKNNVSYMGNSFRGAYESADGSYAPSSRGFSYRLYNSINSGFNQERGRGSILLNYTFREQEFSIRPGETKEIHTSFMETGVRLPISKTMFVKNGAFASSIPALSDRVVRKTAKTEWNTKPTVPVNATYLCSWLYKKSIDQPEGEWRDRYYFPEVVEEMDALHGKTENYINLNHATEEKTIAALRDNGYCDIPSDIVFEKNNTYTYRRVSQNDITATLGELKDDIVNAVRNEDGKLVDLGADLAFNGKTYRKIEIPPKKPVEAINFNADILIDPEKPIGMQLFGATHNSGLTIRNRTDLAPYHYYATESEVMMLNNKYEIVHTLDLATTYGDTILRYFLGDTFENILVVSPRYLYVLSYDLQLKARINLAYATDGE